MPLKPRIDMLIQRLVEQGLIEHYEARVERKLRNDLETRPDRVVSADVYSSSSGSQLDISVVTLTELNFVLLVSAGGLSFGLIAFGLELMLGRHHCVSNYLPYNIHGLLLDATKYAKDIQIYK